MVIYIKRISSSYTVIIVDLFGMCFLIGIDLKILYDFSSYSDSCYVGRLVLYMYTSYNIVVMK
jgi:hypothetical protein